MLMHTVLELDLVKSQHIVNSARSMLILIGMCGEFRT